MPALIPWCQYCDDAGTITIDDDDGHDVYRTERVPCPVCAEEGAEYWKAMDEAADDHRYEAEMMALVHDPRPVDTSGEPLW